MNRENEDVINDNYNSFENLRNFWFVTRLFCVAGYDGIFEKSKPSRQNYLAIRMKNYCQTNKWICFIMMTVTIHRPPKCELELDFFI
jgi:hypothetical protein